MPEYPHMCRMDHEEIGWRGDDERCPVCVARDEAEAARAEAAALRGVLAWVRADQDREVQIGWTQDGRARCCALKGFSEGGRLGIHPCHAAALAALAAKLEGAT